MLVKNNFNLYFSSFIYKNRFLILFVSFSSFVRGSLIALSTSNFASDITWACTSSRTDINNKGWFTVVLEYIEAPESSFMQSLVTLLGAKNSITLLDSLTLYRAHGPILTSIGQMKSVAFPEELVYAQTTDQIQLPLRPRNVSFEDGIQFGEKLDDSQMAAMQVLSQNRLAIVQGPPGTGKTFIGVGFANLLLKNIQHKLSSQTPILVLTHKNHALDEFSKAIIDKIGPSSSKGAFIRLGSGSKEESMASYQLKSQLEKSTDFEHQLTKEIESTQAKISSTFISFQNLMQKPISVDVILRFFDNLQLLNLIRNKLDAKLPSLHLKGYDSKNSVVNTLFEHLVNGKYYTSIDLIRALTIEALDGWLSSDQTTRFEIEKIKKSDYSIRELKREDKVEFVKLESRYKKEDNFETDNKNIDDRLEERITKMGEIGLGQQEFLKIDAKLVHHGIDPYKFETSEPVCLEYLGYLTHCLAANSNLAEFRSCLDPWNISELDRLKLVQTLVFKQRETLTSQMESHYKKLDGLMRQMNKLRSMREATALKKAKVVAMTTTGAAMRKDLLELVKPEVIIIEEAAEINEAQIIAFLGEHVKHLVLIGDHKQLRPQINCFKLERDFNFDLSMMERLINNQIPYATLAAQNRMRPDISKYLLDIYPELTDSHRVHRNLPVSCLSQNMFFWDHDFEEIGGRSYSNPEEAQAAIDLAIFMTQNGYQQNQITILSAYQGQARVLKTLLEKDSRLFTKEIFISTIDMFQGDENDIIIVSLVRNNQNGVTGFLGTLNRRCVAQSRGRSGMIFIGSQKTLRSNAASKKVWIPFLKQLKNDGCFGKELPLRCHKHPKVSHGVKVGDKFSEKFICNEPCGFQNKCGIPEHKCALPCQSSHAHLICSELVKAFYACGIHTGVKKCHEKVCPKPCNFYYHTNGDDFDSEPHPCRKLCGEQHKHEECLEWLKLECPTKQHLISKQCFARNLPKLCTQTVKYVDPACGHNGSKLCHEDIESKKCRENCEKFLTPCGHRCLVKCQPNHSHNNNETKCKTTVRYICPFCKREGIKLCYQKDSEVECKHEVKYDFSCGQHSMTTECYRRGQNIAMKCMMKCSLKLSCGDPCEQICGSEHSHDGSSCQATKNFVHKPCGTELERKCFQKEIDITCTAKCGYKLNCGHSCHLNCAPNHSHDFVICLTKIEEPCLNPRCKKLLLRKCQQPITDVICKEKVKVVRDLCLHSTQVECHLSSDQDSFPPCTEKCIENLKQCGHECSKICGTKHDHRSSKDCKEIVKIAHEPCGSTLRVKCKDSKDDQICDTCDQAPVKLDETRKADIKAEPAKLREKIELQATQNPPKTSKMPENGKQKVKTTNAASKLVNISEQNTKKNCEKCSESWTSGKCEKPCKIILPCGHKCDKKCFEVCKQETCGTCCDKTRKNRKKKRDISASKNKRDSRTTSEKSRKVDEILLEIENLPDNRMQRPAVYQIDPDTFDERYEDVEATQMYQKMRKIAQDYMEISDSLVPRVETVATVQNIAGWKFFLEKQLKLNNPNDRKTMGFFSKESSANPKKFCKIGFHEAIQETSNNSVTFSETQSFSDMPLSSGSKISILICEVLADDLANHLGQCSVSDPYKIFVSGYVTFSLEPLDDLLDSLYDELNTLPIDPRKEFFFTDSQQQIYETVLWSVRNSPNMKLIDFGIEKMYANFNSGALEKFDIKLGKIGGNKSELLFYAGKLEHLEAQCGNGIDTIGVFNMELDSKQFTQAVPLSESGIMPKMLLLCRTAGRVAVKGDTTRVALPLILIVTD